MPFYEAITFIVFEILYHYSLKGNVICKQHKKKQIDMSNFKFLMGGQFCEENIVLLELVKEKIPNDNF